jgi:DNA-binding PadR family transcriptional regulator
LKVFVFYKDASGKSGHWIVDESRLDHTLKVMEARGLIVTGYEKIV